MIKPGSSIVRRATTADIDAVARLLIQVQDQHVRDYPLVFKDMTIEAASTQAAVDIEAGACAVADVAGVAGFIKWAVHDRPENAYTFAARYVAIDAICVDAACRRKGIGQTLLAWVVERGRELGAQRVQLDTWATNAVAFGAFRKAGFSSYNHRLWRWLDH
jgi:ribosomal protein S18 acetylase RimI-like enzyme